MLEEVLEGGSDALLVEDRRAEVEEHVAHAPDRGCDGPVRLGDLGELGMRVGEHLETHLDRRELLHGIVVHVVGDPTSFVFGGPHHVMEQRRRCRSISAQIDDDPAQLLGPLVHHGFELRVVDAQSLLELADRCELFLPLRR